MTRDRVEFCREVGLKVAIAILIVCCTHYVHRELTAARREGDAARRELLGVSRALHRELVAARREGRQARDDLVRAAHGLAVIPAANREALRRVERRLDALGGRIDRLAEVRDGPGRGRGEGGDRP